jgi:hypothetical protein
VTSQSPRIPVIFRNTPFWPLELLQIEYQEASARLVVSGDVSLGHVRKLEAENDGPLPRSHSNLQTKD